MSRLVNVNKHRVWSRGSMDTRLLKWSLESLRFSIFRLPNWRITKAFQRF